MWPTRYHVQKKRERDSASTWAKRIGWVVPAHLFASILLAAILLRFVNGYYFRIRDAHSSNHLPDIVSSLHQSDVVTLLSFAIIFVRGLASSWIAALGWKAAIVVLELQSLSLREFTHMVSYKFPPFKPIPKTGPGHDGRFWISFWMWLGFLLVLPSQLAAPILTGSISWIPRTLFMDPQSIGITTAGPSDGWHDHNLWANSRFYEVVGALGLAASASTRDFNSSHDPILRRFVPSIKGAPSGGVLDVISLPYFRIESLEWFSSLNDFKEDLGFLHQAIWSETFPNLNVTDSWNPLLTGTDSGRITIVNTQPWQNTQYHRAKDQYEFPSPSIQSNSKYVIVADEIPDVSASTGSVDGPGVLGDVGDVYRYGCVHKKPGDTCYLIGKVNYTAGVHTCRNCTILSDGQVVADPSSVKSPALWEVEPDPLVQNAIDFMPETLFWMKASNASFIPMWNNLDGYARGMLSVAYQSSWNSLTNYADSGTDIPTTVKSPLHALEASIDIRRVMIWLAANALLSLSMIVLTLGQLQSRLEVVNYPELAALLLNTKLLEHKPENDVVNSSDVDIGKKDSSIRLRLVVPADGEKVEQDPYLEVQVVGESPSKAVTLEIPKEDRSLHGWPER